MSHLEPLLVMKGIHKRFPGVHALKGVDFTLQRGEVHGLVGENGAGKSTLMNVLGGEYLPEEGQIYIDGKEVSLSTPAKAKEHNISFIHQELSLFQDMDIASNIFIENLPKKSMMLNKKEMYRKTKEILKTIKLTQYHPTQKLSDLKIGEQQLVEIGRALARNTQILVLDEPTSSLTDSEIAILFDIIQSLKEKGVSIVFITHRLDEIFQVCDNITIMRDGNKIKTCKLKDMERKEIVKDMIGRDVDEFYQHESHSPGETLLEVRHLSRKDKLFDISFELKKGEVLGLYGLLGSGRTEILRCIFGMDPMESGEILINGSPVAIKRPKDAIQNRIAMISEDRRQEGLVLEETVQYNLSLSNLKSIQSSLFVDRKKEANISEKFIGELNIKTPSAKNKVELLSGGNQQKVVIGKWLNTSPAILLMDEPTRGIDIGAKSEIYKIIEQLLKQDVGIILASSELAEIIGLCDRVLVMKEGREVALLEDQEITSKNLLYAAMGAE